MGDYKPYGPHERWVKCLLEALLSVPLREEISLTTAATTEEFGGPGAVA